MAARGAALLLILASLPACAAPMAAIPRTGSAHGAAVAIFEAPGFPYYGGSRYLSPEAAAADLRKIGVNARTLGLNALSSSAQFNRGRFALLINLYGNTFPLDAYPNIRRFHLAGGGIISTGVPFTHPVQLVGAAFWGASPDWGRYVSVDRTLSPPALRLRGQDGNWSGASSIRVPAHPGETVQVSGRIRVTGPEQGRDFLYVRFYNAAGQYMTQRGPALPAGGAWENVTSSVRVPAGAAAMDLSPQVWTPGVTAWLTGLSLRRRGHELIANGSFQQSGGGWRDLGHTGQYLGQSGMGMGGFGGPAPGERVRAAPNNPIHLTGGQVPFAATDTPQFLDPRGLPKQDQVIPITLAISPQSHVLGYPEALIVHRDGGSDVFAGAVDGWAGATDADSARQAFFLRQMVEREAIAALQREGALPAGAAQTGFTHLAAETAPPGPPHDLPLPIERRPYPTFFPVSPAPARHLFVADVERLNKEDRLLLTSLQGLVNRRQPRIFLIFGGGDRTWLNWMRQEGDTGAPIIVADPMSLLRRFHSEFHEAVIPDPALYIGVDIAADVSGADSLLIANPTQARQYGLKVAADLRGRFHSDADALSWVATHLYPHLNHFLMMVAHPDLAYNGSFDYMIQHKGIVFWISGEKDGVGPGRNPLAEQQVMERLFARMPVNIPVRGFWWHGDGVGVGEGPGVTLGSRFGKVTVVSDGMTNISVHSGTHASSLKQAAPAPPPALDRSKVYYAFTMSDGDNLDTHFGYFMDYVLSPLHGKIPVGWGMGPTLIDLAPDVARWYYGRATPVDEYVCDVSGVGYMYPASFATAYHDRQKVIDDFLRWTARYMKRMDQRTVRPMGEDTSQLQRYDDLIPGMECLIPGYGRNPSVPYPQLTYSLPDGLPVFRAVTNAEGGNDRMAYQVMDTVGTRRPAFVNLFVWNWGFKMTDLAAIQQKLGPDYVAVTPYQLSLLYKEAHRPTAAR